MTDKELRRLSKAELVEIIYQQKKTEEALKRKLQKAAEKLNTRDLKVNKAGSIAEAAISVNGVFEAAQKAADDYLKSVYDNYSDVDTRCKKMLADTEAKCKKMLTETETHCKKSLADTEAACKKREQDTDKAIRNKWTTFQTKAKEYINAHEELSGFLKK